MIDIDEFKRINDGYGHVHGDFLIKQTVVLIQQVLPRKRHFVGRYGGDEFYIVVHNSDYNTLKFLADEIENKLIEYNSRVSDENKIMFSSGHDIYNKSLWANLSQFHHRIEHLMYNNKK